MFEKIRPTVLGATASVFLASCVSERGRYDFSYDCASAEVKKAALNTWNTTIFTYGGGNPISDPEARKTLTQGTKLAAIKTLGKHEHGYQCGTMVHIPSFYSKALKGHVNEAVAEYFYNVQLMEDGTFVLDGRQGAWFQRTDRTINRKPHRTSVTLTPSPRLGVPPLRGSLPF